MTKNKESILKTVEIIKQKVDYSPSVAMILGSGLGVMADSIENPIFFDYSELEGFKSSKVEGHANTLILGEIQGKKVVTMKGRFHYYEGYSLYDVTYPVRVFEALGAKTLIVTNAAGGVNPYFRAGDLMCIEDHINMLGDNPLIGVPSEFGAKFIDMTTAYDSNLKKIAEKSAALVGIALKNGVYYANSGPSYETPAEVRMIRSLGGDAVGMSTVPEVIVARQVGLKVLGISCITNMAAGITGNALSHEEVLETSQIVRKDFIKLINEIIKNL